MEKDQEENIELLKKRFLDNETKRKHLIAKRDAEKLNKTMTASERKIFLGTIRDAICYLNKKKKIALQELSALGIGIFIHFYLRFPLIKCL